MITPSLIRILFVLGVIGLVITGFSLIAERHTIEKVTGLLIMTLGVLVWRIVCEGIFLSFGIYESLRPIEKLMKENQFKQQGH